MINSFDVQQPHTLWQRWEANAQQSPDAEAIIHWIAGETPIRWTFQRLLEAARCFAVWLHAQGVNAGDVCALIVRHHPAFYPLYLGVSAIGAFPAVLAYPNPRLHPDKFRHGLEGMAQRSGLDWILTEHELEPLITPLITQANTTIKGVLFPLLEHDDFTVESSAWNTIRQSIPDNPNAPCLLQHSSGTTGLQKPVVLSHRAVLEHIANYAAAIALTPADKIVSWLPLYHDMGLIAAFHLPLAYGIPSIQIDPFEWVVAPVLLFEAISQERATLTWLPNFAYNILAEKVPDDELEQISLDTVRMVINCSEPIRAESHQRFLQRFMRYGLHPNALSTCYAMAETTFAATQAPANQALVSVLVDRQQLAQGNIVLTDQPETARLCVSSGIPISGCELRIVDAQRQEVGPGRLGEIAIRSVSLFDGYRNYPEKTANVLLDGWYYSGDYGFCVDGQYFVIGRKKDIIIVAGKNIYPEDIEDEIGRVAGVIPGRVAAFGEEDAELGTEQISVVAETAVQTEHEQHALEQAIRLAGMGIDVDIRKVYLVPPRWLIKSSSGKPSRSANKERLLKMQERE